MLDAGQHGRVGYLVAVEMQDGQHGAIGDRIEELVRVPCRCQWTCFCFTVTDHAGDNQLRIVEHSAEGVAERVSQLAPLVDRSRAFW